MINRIMLGRACKKRESENQAFENFWSRYGTQIQNSA